MTVLAPFKTRITLWVVANVLAIPIRSSLIDFDEVVAKSLAISPGWESK